MKLKLKFDRLLLAFILNIIMIIFATITLILEIINVYTAPDSIYQNIWGLFRYFTLDGNILSFICTIIISIREFRALIIDKPENIKSLIVSHFLFIISLMSACTDFVIFVVVMFIFMPIADEKWRKGLVGSFNASCFHITIPILLNFRFIFLDMRERDLKLCEKFYGGAPMCLYGVIMLILCIAKVFKSYDRYIENGDGKIPYPFLDVYHEKWYFCFGIAIFIFVFGFGIGFLLEFLNKKCEKLILPYNFVEECEKQEDINPITEPETEQVTEEEKEQV